MALYRTYSDYLKEKYNEKVYKIPIALPVTCPNRDGTLDSDGCIFAVLFGRTMKQRRWEWKSLARLIGVFPMWDRNIRQKNSLLIF